MDVDETNATAASAGFNNTTKVQIDNAIRALHQKKPVPEIDFTLHTMEDGNQVSTLERVCKGKQTLHCHALTVLVGFVH